jgi:DNA-directed RNA polymerase subunit RPC12/RpoP
VAIPTQLQQSCIIYKKMKLITLRTFDNYIAANMLLTQMEYNGIKCYLQDEISATVYPILGNAIGGVKLAVLDADFAAAQQLLLQLDAAYLAAIACPSCGSNGLQYVTKPGAKNFFSAIVTSLIASYAVAVAHTYKCTTCNWENKRLPEIE